MKESIYLVWFINSKSQQHHKYSGIGSSSTFILIWEHLCFLYCLMFYLPVLGGPRCVTRADLQLMKPPSLGSIYKCCDIY